MPYTHTVFLTQDAMDDLEAIHDYIFCHDSPGKADYVIGKIEKTFGKLTLFPERGAYRNLRSGDYGWYHSSLVFPAFLDFPDFPEVSGELRFRILYVKFKARRAEEMYRLLCDSTLRPEEVCKPLNDEIRQWREKDPHHPFWYEFYSLRRDRVSWLMMEHYRKLPLAGKPDYAEVIVKELLALAQEEIPTADRGVSSDFRVIVPGMINQFESDKISDVLVAKLKSQLSMIIFATSQDEELLNFAAEQLK